MARGKCNDPGKEAERARKISDARQRRLAETGRLNSDDTRQKMADVKRGRSQTAEHRQNISAAKRGIKPKNFDDALAKAHATPKPKGEANPAWKGDAVGYGALHRWVFRNKPRPLSCEHCGTTTAKRYEWANKSRCYLRDLDDWMNLCVSCHRRYDPCTPWNKGKKTGPRPRKET